MREGRGEKKKRESSRWINDTLWEKKRQSRETQRERKRERERGSGIDRKREKRDNSTLFKFLLICASGKVHLETF